MIELLIFELHIVGALYAFTKNWLKGTIKDGLLALGIIGLIFTIGWALTGPIAGMLMPDKWNSVYFTTDTLSLVILLIPEMLFFYFYFVKD
jgi:hypothetical protein